MGRLKEDNWPWAIKHTGGTTRPIFSYKKRGLLRRERSFIEIVRALKNWRRAPSTASSRAGTFPQSPVLHVRTISWALGIQNKERSWERARPAGLSMRKWEFFIMQPYPSRLPDGPSCVRRAASQAGCGGFIHGRDSRASGSQAPPNPRGKTGARVPWASAPKKR